MPERILGLDIGASSVKAVLLSRGFRGGYRVLGFRRIDTRCGGRSPGGPASSSSRMQTFRGSVCVTALPAGAALLPEHPASLPRRPEDPPDPRLCPRTADPDAPRRGLHRLHADRPGGTVGDLRRPRPPRPRRRTDGAPGRVCPRDGGDRYRRRPPCRAPHGEAGLSGDRPSARHRRPGDDGGLRREGADPPYPPFSLRRGDGDPAIAAALNSESAEAEAMKRSGEIPRKRRQRSGRSATVS